MAEDIESKDDETATPEARPENGIGFYLVKVLAVSGMIGLAGLELFSEQSVSPFIYAALATIAGGPEVAGFLKK